MKSWHCGNARCFSSAISESSSFEASLGAAQVPYFFLPGAAQVLALFLEYNDVDASFLVSHSAQGCPMVLLQHQNHKVRLCLVLAQHHVPSDEAKRFLFLKTNFT